MSDNKITFSALPAHIEAFSKPLPASKVVPEWVKRLDRHIDRGDGSGVSSVKGCIPFLDAITSGYVICAPCDFVIRGTQGDSGAEWDFAWGIHNGMEDPELIKEHLLGQVEGEHLTSLGALQLKLKNFFSVHTPKGYSCLFTPVLNNKELMIAGIHFHSAIVDTDSYGIAVQLPFSFTNLSGEPITVEKGTPLVQVLPFKRERWKMEVTETNHEKEHGKRLLLGSLLSDSYRRLFHKKKTYS